MRTHGLTPKCDTTTTAANGAWESRGQLGVGPLINRELFTCDLAVQVTDAKCRIAALNT